MPTAGGPLQHVYVTAHGAYTAPNWIGETAQIGVRVVPLNASQAPAKGSVFTLPDMHGDITVASGSTPGANGTLAQAWTARLGPVGSGENFDAARQIDIAEDVRTFLAAIASRQYSGFKWTHVKVSPIRADGGYGAASSTYQFTTPIVGGASPALPPEVACCVSLRANIIGRRGRGRMYIPALADANDLDGTVKGTYIATFKTAGATLIANLDNVPGTPVWGQVVAIMSAGFAEPGTGARTAVRPSEVRVGSHFDAQRRRQNALPEVYTSQAL